MASMGPLKASHQAYIHNVNLPVWERDVSPHCAYTINVWGCSKHATPYPQSQENFLSCWLCETIRLQLFFCDLDSAGPGRAACLAAAAPAARRSHARHEMVLGHCSASRLPAPLFCVTALLLPAACTALSYCAGEFSLCPDGSCALVPSACGHCQPTQYHCPLDGTCLHRVEDYATICQGLAGTHLDTRLSEEARLNWLVDAVATNMTELTQQLVNNAPAIDRLGVPAYNYLNDDEHGVIGTASATVFPMGVGMGASWSSETVQLVGAAIGVEARSTHNVLADKSGNSCGGGSTGKKTANGCGITLYAPNINLLRDPVRASRRCLLIAAG
jgi:hypothetical protein